MSPQKRGVVPPATAKRLAELAETSRTSAAELKALTIKTIQDGSSYREVQKVTGIEMTTLRRWIKAAGGLPRAEAERQRLAEQRRHRDRLMGLPPDGEMT